MRTPGIVDMLAAWTWQRLFPGRPVPARMPQWLRIADVALSVSALGVVVLGVAIQSSGPLHRQLVADDGQLLWAGRLLAGSISLCSIIAGIGSARLGASIDSLTLRNGLRPLDGWFPLRGRWLGLVLCLLLGLVGGGLVLFGLAQPFHWLFLEPTD